MSSAEEEGGYGMGDRHSAAHSFSCRKEPKSVENIHNTKGSVILILSCIPRGGSCAFLGVLFDCLYCMKAASNVVHYERCMM